MGALVSDEEEEGEGRRTAPIEGVGYGCLFCILDCFVLVRGRHIVWILGFMSQLTTQDLLRLELPNYEYSIAS